MNENMEIPQNILENAEKAKKHLLPEKSKALYDKDVQQNQGIANQNSPYLHTERPIYQIEQLHRAALYETPHTTVRDNAARCCQSIHPVECMLNAVPLLKWLPEYSWKRSFMADIISGITVGIIQIPQGMAYGLLGNVPPIFGIYMAFFPVLVYFIFGTSRHVAIGTFAIVSLMIEEVVSDHATIETMKNSTARTFNSNSAHITNGQVAVTVTFGVAVVQLLMYMFRLGVVSSLLSETLVSGFTCGTAFQIISSQLKDLLGLPIGKRRGNFSFVYTLYDVILAIPKANTTATIISSISCILLLINNEIIKPWLLKKTRLYFPMEMLTMTVGTVVTYYSGIHKTHNISTVGFIPTGLPAPALPVFSLLPEIWLNVIVITMVSYTITMSMALIFARKLKYKVDPNQELLALGLGNSVGSFFSCMPVASSLFLSVIQEAVGGVTQLTSIVSSIVLLVVLLWVGPVFETLPRCVLASIIIIALKGMVMQVKALPRHWRMSRWDGLVWTVTFVTTLFVHISVGLAVGVAASLICFAAQGLIPHASILGRLAGTDLYLDMKRYKAAVEVAGLKIIQFVGGLNFASRNSFKKLIVQKVGFDAAAILRKRVKLREKGLHVDEEREDLLAQGIILDFSSVTFLDPSGVEYLRKLQSDLESLGITLYIAGCSDSAYEVMTNCDRWEKKDSKFAIFPTIHDAVLYSQTNTLAKDIVKPRPT